MTTQRAYRVNKLKPVRTKHEFRDRREHRKLDFYRRIQMKDWSDILSKDNIDSAVIEFNNTEFPHILRCRHLKITPLVLSAISERSSTKIF